NRLAAASQPAGKMTVGFGDAFARIDNEEGYVRGSERPLGVDPHPALERGRGSLFETGGVDDPEAEIRRTALHLPAVAGQPRGIVDQGRSAADEPVEKRRLPDIRSSQYGDRKAHRSGWALAFCLTVNR